jgi:hypothetical protein
MRAVGKQRAALRLRQLLRELPSIAAATLAATLAATAISATTGCMCHELPHVYLP